MGVYVIIMSKYLRTYYVNCFIITLTMLFNCCTESSCAQSGRPIYSKYSSSPVHKMHVPIYINYKWTNNPCWDILITGMGAKRCKTLPLSWQCCWQSWLAGSLSHSWWGRPPSGHWRLRATLWEGCRPHPPCPQGTCRHSYGILKSESQFFFFLVFIKEAPSDAQ